MIPQKIFRKILYTLLNNKLASIKPMSAYGTHNKIFSDYSSDPVKPVGPLCSFLILS